MSCGVLVAERALESQRAIAGSMLIDPECVGDVLLQLQDKDFIDTRYRMIFQAFRRLYNEGRHIDPLTVNDALGGNWNQILADCMDQTPTSANVMEWVAILKRRSLQFRLAELGEKLAEEIDLDAALAVVDEINAVSCRKEGVKITTMSQALREFLDRHGEGKKPPYLTWGIEALDSRVHIEAGDMVVLGGYPSAGKTALALQFCRHIAKGKRVGYFYLENNDRKLFDRLVTSTTLVPFSKIKRFELGEEEFRTIISMQEYLTSPQLEFIGASGMTVADIRSIALAKHYDVIAVDYLQKISGDRSSRSASDFEAVSRISSDLQDLVQQTGITIIALSQLRRPDTKNSKAPAPTMASLRQSGQIEQDADVVMLVYFEDDSEPKKRTLKLAKNKEGEANIAMRMIFDGDSQTFSRVAPDTEPASKKTMRQLFDAGKAARNRNHVEAAGQTRFWGDGSDWQELSTAEETPFAKEGESE